MCSAEGAKWQSRSWRLLRTALCIVEIERACCSCRGARSKEQVVALTCSFSRATWMESDQYGHARARKLQSVFHFVEYLSSYVCFARCDVGCGLDVLQRSPRPESILGKHDSYSTIPRKISGHRVTLFCTLESALQRDRCVASPEFRACCVKCICCSIVRSVPPATSNLSREKKSSENMYFAS